MFTAFERARKAFIYGLLMMAVGAVSIVISVFTGVSLLHPYLASALLCVGLFLSVLGRLAIRSIRKEFLGEYQKDKKESNEWDGWTHLGGGLYCRKQDIEDRDAEIERRKKFDAYVKAHGLKKPNKS